MARRKKKQLSGWFFVVSFFFTIERWYAPCMFDRWSPLHLQFNARFSSTARGFLSGGGLVFAVQIHTPSSQMKERITLIRMYVCNSHVGQWNCV